MNVLKKAISLIMALVISMTVWMPTLAATPNNTLTEDNITGISDYVRLLSDEGYPVLTTQKFAGIIQTVRKIISFLTGKEYKPQTFNVTIDGILSDISAYVCENSGLDMEKILTNLPDITIPARLIVETFNLDTAVLRDRMYKKGQEYKAEGNKTMEWIYRFLGVYMSIIEVCEVCATETSDPDIYEVEIRFTFKDGGQDSIHPGIFINTVTGECTNKDNSGIIGSGFNYSFADMVLYATVDCWMRDFGFNMLYDMAATSMPVFFNYRTRRFKFEYDGLEWMIQIWKGNYLIANGGEVGLYCREPERFGSHYDSVSDERMLDIAMQIYHGDELLVNKPMQKHWWANGFNLGDTLYRPGSLTMNFSIAMPDEEMLKAFCQAMDKHYMHDVSYTVDGLTVNVVW